jgi:hypothetical protein
MQKTRQKKKADKIHLNLYSIHGSLVERQLPTKGCACSSPGNSTIFKLGLSLCKKCAKTVAKNPPKHECACLDK